MRAKKNAGPGERHRTRAVLRWGLVASGIALYLATGSLAQAQDTAGAAPGDQLMLVLNKIESRANKPGNLAVLDVTRDTVLQRIPVGNEPHEVALSDDHRLALVSNTGSYDGPGHTLSLIDVAKAREIHRVELGPLGIPHGLGFAKGKFYFTTEVAKALGRYDPATNSVDWVLGLGGDGVHMLRISQDGNTIYASERSSGRIAVAHYQAPSNPFIPAWKVSHWDVCAGPEGLDLAPDGKTLWVGCRTDNRIVSIDVSSGAIVHQMATGTQALVRVKFTRDGHYLLASDLRTGNVLVIDPKALVIVKTIHVGSGCEGILIAPDGRYAYVAVTADNAVAQIDLQTLQVSKMLHTGLGPDGMAWLAN